MKRSVRVKQLNINGVVVYKIQKRIFFFWVDHKEASGTVIFDDKLMAEMYINLKNMQKNGIDDKSNAIKFVGKKD